MQLILRRSLVFIALMVAGLVIYTQWFNIKANQYDETVVPYLQSALPDLVSWQFESLQLLLSPSAKGDFENEKMRDAYRSFKQLGEFRSMQKPQYLGHASSSSAVLGEIEVIDYQVVVELDSGPATIKLKLFNDGKSYFIHHFSIQSDVFASTSGN